MVGCCQGDRPAPLTALHRLNLAPTLFPLIGGGLACMISCHVSTGYFHTLAPCRQYWSMAKAVVSDQTEELYT